MLLTFHTHRSCHLLYSTEQCGDRVDPSRLRTTRRRRRCCGWLCFPISSSVCVFHPASTCVEHLFLFSLLCGGFFPSPLTVEVRVRCDTSVGRGHTHTHTHTEGEGEGRNRRYWSHLRVFEVGGGPIENRRFLVYPK
ncbi:hypothetical protein ABB37_08787 [Leptomonas pyrrhocoris]|uniref:Uncharacterized protein n=1 Tax=Leptomonas pyrrhocoris TaxID=157538 RepID=A0A0M9FSE1_LEPPY|nr:hypothetical protein ABB37_08787 [Leptomonas pyrrhocoris]KPA75120.1 hypothetical protein ABB37_08787 [Leptomonas pyrrhocoris]|eukprot:XP_015653559.1 hypothetical protein ABB37_08787 [Leptomonas pyrrhocoris]